MSSFSSALFRFLILIRLFSASALRRFNFCSAAGFSDSSSGGPLGRGSLPRHSCMRRFCMTASRSCRAERNSFDSLRVEREESVPPREPPLRRRPVVEVQCEAALLSCSWVSCGFSVPECRLYLAALAQLFGLSMVWKGVESERFWIREIQEIYYIILFIYYFLDL